MKTKEKIYPAEYPRKTFPDGRTYISIPGDFITVGLLDEILANDCSKEGLCDAYTKELVFKFRRMLLAENRHLPDHHRVVLEGFESRIRNYDNGSESSHANSDSIRWIVESIGLVLLLVFGHFYVYSGITRNTSQFWQVLCLALIYVIVGLVCLFFARRVAAR
jgi:hypothetical protein